MNSNLLIKSSLKNIRHHKIRSVLTVLGIIIGVAAIISTLSIGYGAEKRIRERVMAWGDRMIFLWAGSNLQESASKAVKQKRTKYMNFKDIEALKKMCKKIKKISPVLFRHGCQLEVQGKGFVGEIKGGNEDILEILGRKVEHGSNFSKHQMERGAKVILIGQKVAKELFKNINPIGQVVKIKNDYFTIVGVVGEIDETGRIPSPNSESFVPFNTSKKCFHGSNQWVHENNVHMITMMVENLEDMPEVVSRVRKVMRARHALDPEEPDDFSIVDQRAILNAAQESSKTFNIFLLIVSLISLMVGGIGVMNIMLVSVAERRKEIGIRMALGAPTKTILRQFLIEAIILCALGGTVGIFIGIVTPLLISCITDIYAVIKIETILIATAAILIVGTLFGYYPAKQASKLNPVEALEDK
jgi:putative ABC transport system permease protein